MSVIPITCIGKAFNSIFINKDSQLRMLLQKSKSSLPSYLGADGDVHVIDHLERIVQAKMWLKQGPDDIRINQQRVVNRAASEKVDDLIKISILSRLFHTRNHVVLVTRANVCHLKRI
ncbi:hypothetical protein Tco_1055841 [Tanacetum coccineum]|uniref:Uncharacterized protein n=1 Tax=Tanacetum coccineum TaxID=301880 RepID=A0ABQ5H1P6_9ASTR